MMGKHGQAAQRAQKRAFGEQIAQSFNHYLLQSIFVIKESSMTKSNATRSQKAKKTPTKPTRTVIRNAKDSMPLELNSRFR